MTMKNPKTTPESLKAIQRVPLIYNVKNSSFIDMKTHSTGDQ